MKRLEVVHAVDRDPVVGDPFADRDADRGDLLAIDPNASGVFTRFGLEVPASELLNKELFKLAQKTSDVVIRAKAFTVQLDDRIDHELAWTMVGQVATAFALRESHPLRQERGRRHVPRAGRARPLQSAAARDHGLMLHE